MNEQGAKLLEKIKARRGYTMAQHEYLAEHHPEFLAGHDVMFTAATSDDSPLPKKVREFIIMAADMCMDMGPKAVAGHARRAREAGATDEELLAVIELVTMVYAGKPLAVGIAGMTAGG